MDVDICLMEPEKRVQMVESRQRKKKWLRMDGPDGGWAWLVALSACSINFIMAGLGRMSGILYVAFIEQFGVNRKTATAPFSIRSSTRNLLGPVVGILGQQFSVRSVTIAGSIIGFLSSASCYFAPDMQWITILWGGFNGVGTAMTMLLAQVVIDQHFVVHRTTAAGLAYSGGCVGSFLFPVLIEYLLQNYGMQGTFLILSGIVMHCIPAAMMLRKPAWMRKGSRQSSGIQKEPKSEIFSVEIEKPNVVHENGIQEPHSLIESNVVNEIIHDGCGDKSLFERFYWLERDMDLVAQVVISAMESTGKTREAENGGLKLDKLAVLDILRNIYNIATRSFRYDSTSLTQDLVGPTPVNQKNLEFVQYFTSLQPITIAENWKNHQLSGERPKYEEIGLEVLSEVQDICNLYLQQEPQQNPVSGGKTSPVVDSNEANESKSWAQRLKGHAITSVTLYANPMYVLISLCRAIHFITYIPAVTVIVDFCMDKGLPEEDGKFVIAALAAGDLVGRLCLGWITDKGYIHLPKYMFFNMLIQGVSTAALPVMPNRWSLFLMFSIFGMLEGSLFIRHAVLIKNYLNEDQQSIAMGSMNFLSGLIGFGLPYYIGYFRDILGSYDLMFYINGALGSGVGIVWVLEPYFAECIAKKKASPKSSMAAV